MRGDTPTPPPRTQQEGLKRRTWSPTARRVQRSAKRVKGSKRRGRRRTSHSQTCNCARSLVWGFAASLPVGAQPPQTATTSYLGHLNPTPPAPNLISRQRKLFCAGGSSPLCWCSVGLGLSLSLRLHSCSSQTGLQIRSRSCLQPSLQCAVNSPLLRVEKSAQQAVQLPISHPVIVSSSSSRLRGSGCPPCRCQLFCTLQRATPEAERASRVGEKEV